MAAAEADVANETFFTTLETITYVIMQISFLVTAMGLPYHRNHRMMSSLPFISLALHCFIWSIHHVRQSNAPHIIPNFSGLIVGLIGVVTFHIYSKKKIPPMYITTAVIVSIITCIFAYEDMYDVVHAIGAVSILLMMVSQLPSALMVIQTKSSASVPLVMAVTIPLNGLMQMLYNVFIARNFLTAEAYGIGVVFSALQLMLFVYYKPPSDEDVDGFDTQMDYSYRCGGNDDDCTVDADDEFEEVIFESVDARGGQMIMMQQQQLHQHMRSS